MHSCNPFASLSKEPAIRAAGPSDDAADLSAQTQFSITELARELNLTHRALRFYESRGLLAPQRDGRRRIFSRADRDRLAVILKGKKLGFTITEIADMIGAQSGRASTHSLKLTAEKCAEQIAFFERQMREASEAITELRTMHRLLTQKR